MCPTTVGPLYVLVNEKITHDPKKILRHFGAKGLTITSRVATDVDTHGAISCRFRILGHNCIGHTYIGP